MLPHSVEYPIRYYECDAYDHVNHANYIRYMSEAAFSASAAVGYTPQRLADMKRVWLAREHEIEFLHPYRFGDQVKIKTWVADFRRVRSQRIYHFYLEQPHGDDLLAARAATDWVFVDLETGRPTTVSAEMVAAFQNQNSGPAETELPRTRFPEAPPPPAVPYTAFIDVEWRDVDPQGHVNNAAYLSYIENSTWQLCEACGWPPQRLAERRLGIINRRYRIEYLAPAVMGDKLAITTWISDVRRATAVRHYAVHRADDRTLLARARALWVWVDLDNGRPCRIPPEFMADFQMNLSQESIS